MGVSGVREMSHCVAADGGADDEKDGYGIRDDRRERDVEEVADDGSGDVDDGSGSSGPDADSHDSDSDDLKDGDSNSSEDSDSCCYLG